MEYKKQRLLRQAGIDWIASRLSARECEYAFVTLTLKQGIKRDKKPWEPLTAEAAQADVQMFLDMLNSRVFGNAYRRYGKRLAAIDGTEGGDKSEKRRHRHMLIEVPSRLDFSTFESLVREIRMKSRWQHRRIDVQRARTVQGVTAYMTKTKTGIDAICLDTTAF